LACDDGLFHERIAVYPCVNRAAVLPLLPSLAQYRFYRIDDHLTDVCRRAGAYGYLPRVQFYSAEVIDCVPYAPDPARCQTDHATYLRLAQARDREVDGLRAWREAIEAQTAAPAVAVS
jgi:hypothetical protein